MTGFYFEVSELNLCLSLLWSDLSAQIKMIMEKNDEQQSFTLLCETFPKNNGIFFPGLQTEASTWRGATSLT